MPVAGGRLRRFLEFIPDRTPSGRGFPRKRETETAAATRAHCAPALLDCMASIVHSCEGSFSPLRICSSGKYQYFRSGPNERSQKCTIDAIQSSRAVAPRAGGRVDAAGIGYSPWRLPEDRRKMGRTLPHRRYRRSAGPTLPAAVADPGRKTTVGKAHQKCHL